MKNRLDSTAIVHCALMRKNWINAYRIVITMDHPVNKDILQQALDSMPDRYPTICSRITKDMFWYYTEKLDRLVVREDDGVLLGSVNYKNMYNQAINIMYSGDKIIMEAFHSVTDGHGAFTFLNSLVGAYLAIEKGSLRVNAYKGTFVEEELEDAFMKNYTKTDRRKSPFTVSKPYFFEKDTENKSVNATTFRMKTASVREQAKANRCSMNDFLLALVFSAIFSIKETKQKDVVLTVPVNLRRHFDSPSLLNFTYLSETALKNNEKLSFRQMTEEIHRQVKRQNTPEYMKKAVSQIAGIYKIPFVSILPLAVKNFAIRLVTGMGVEKSCMTVTNLGNIANMMPAGEGRIKNINVILSPRRNAPYNCGIISHNDRLNITFTHGKIRGRLIENFAAQLDKIGIPYQLVPVTE